MSHNAKMIALDIETSGIDPTEHHVVAIGIATADKSDARIDSEPELLRWLESAIATSGTSVLVTWNGNEFDLPFLAERYRHHAISTSLVTEPTAKIGKYGKPLHDCIWARISHFDIADSYKAIADKANINWGLKSVAREVLGINPVEVNNSGPSIAQMDDRKLLAYLRSDIEITLQLAHKLTVEGHLLGPVLR